MNAPSGCRGCVSRCTFREAKTPRVVVTSIITLLFNIYAFYTYYTINSPSPSSPLARLGHVTTCRITTNKGLGETRFNFKMRQTIKKLPPSADKGRLVFIGTLFEFTRKEKKRSRRLFALSGAEKPGATRAASLCYL